MMPRYDMRSVRVLWARLTHPWPTRACHTDVYCLSFQFCIGSMISRRQQGCGWTKPVEWDYGDGAERYYSITMVAEGDVAGHKICSQNSGLSEYHRVVRPWRALRLRNSVQIKGPTTSVVLPAWLQRAEYGYCNSKFHSLGLGSWARQAY